MEKRLLWYLSGAVDCIGNFQVNIKKDDRVNLGYTINPRLRMSRPNEGELFYEVVDDYCEQLDITPRYFENSTGSSIQMEIGNSDEIARFLDPIIPGFVQQHDRADFFLNEILPKFEEEPPQNKEEFIEVVELKSELEGYPIERGSTKYTPEYFRDEWGL